MELLEEDRHPPIGEWEIRRRIDRAIGRALVDARFATQLLADPTLALGGAGCTPQQWLDLRAIHATSLKDLAHQAEARFWPTRWPAPAESGEQTIALAQ